MIPTSILAAQIVISLKSKTTPNIKSKNINVTTNINKSRFLSITFFSFTPPTQTNTAHTVTHALFLNVTAREVVRLVRLWISA